jgi:mevalonate kinase
MTAACAKAIVCGEHFVLHGCPAIAVPVPERSLRLVQDCRGSTQPSKGGGGTRLLQAWNLARSAFGLHEATDFPFAVESSIPQRAGLGSSAALSVALSRAAAAEAGLAPSPREIVLAATAVEAAFHSRSSGIDPAAVALAHPLVMQPGGVVEELPWDLPGFDLAVAVVPVPRDTDEAIRRVDAFAASRAARFADMVSAARRLVRDVADLVSGRGPARGVPPGPRASAAGALLSANHALLAEAGVSSDALDAVAAAMNAAGALGAKLTGAGIGGATLALVETGLVPRVLESAVAAGAVNVFACRPGRGE